MSIFEGDDVPETHASLRIYFRVTSVEPDPDHPTRPKIHFAGELDGKFSVTGFVKVTPDDQSWWHFVRASFLFSITNSAYLHADSYMLVPLLCLWFDRTAGMAMGIVVGIIIILCGGACRFTFTAHDWFSDSRTLQS